MKNKKYSLWKYLELENVNMDFDKLEDKIKTFDMMVKQGLIKNQFQKALNEGKVNFTASFNDIDMVKHKLEIVGADICDYIARIKGNVVTEILVDDIKINGKSIICTHNNMVN